MSFLSLTLRNCFSNNNNNNNNNDEVDCDTAHIELKLVESGRLTGWKPVLDEWADVDVDSKPLVEEAAALSLCAFHLQCELESPTRTT